METAVIQLISAFIGALGFSLLFGMRSRYLFAAAMGGVLCWGVYLAMEALFHSMFFSCLIAAAAAVLYAELLARMLKTPATLFVIPAVIPLVPGSSLYYTMDSAVRGHIEAAQEYGNRTLVSALAIAAGMSIVLAFRELRSRR